MSKRYSPNVSALLYFQDRRGFVNVTSIRWWQAEYNPKTLMWDINGHITNYIHCTVASYTEEDAAIAAIMTIYTALESGDEMSSVTLDQDDTNPMDSQADTSAKEEEE